MHFSKNPVLNAVYKSLLVFQHFGLQTEALVHREMFMECFQYCVVCEIDEYPARNPSIFKVRLTLGNAPGDPETVQHALPNVEMICLPPNTHSLPHSATRITYHSYL